MIFTEDMTKHPFSDEDDDEMPPLLLDPQSDSEPRGSIVPALLFALVFALAMGGYLYFVVGV